MEASVPQRFLLRGSYLHRHFTATERILLDPHVPLSLPLPLAPLQARPHTAVQRFSQPFPSNCTARLFKPLLLQLCVSMVEFGLVHVSQ